ncbi:PadR family transcriptional regulator [Actinoplanes sp. NPDC051851]|uniref:PadR family transcriptional regulator n=1 Tax=Actinoplanes sp. NPDC051851 TaxID=3154753 RepID=UPI003439D887
MSLRYALLGLLEDGPASGYTLTGRFDRSLRRFAWSAQQSHIYPELNRLATEGLIEVAEEGPRGRRTYALTDSGRTALRTWLLSEPKPHAVRDERMLRIMLISALDPPEARAQLEKHLSEALISLDELRTWAAAADADTTHPRGGLRYGRLALELGIHQNEATISWARWALTRLDETP